MISVTGITGNYILQPALIEKHQNTITWISSTMLWKSELAAFQKMLDERAILLTSVDDKKRVSHFQNLITYYKGEVLTELRKKLRDHESRLAGMLESKNELDVKYYQEHDSLMDHLKSFSHAFKEFRNEFLAFVQKVN